MSRHINSSACTKPLLICLFFILLFLSLSISFSSFADPNSSNEEWHYTLRPGDNLQTISHNLLNHQYSLSDLIRHNHIDQHSIVAPGSILRIPLHWLKQQPQPATIKAITGTVQLKRAGSARFERLNADMTIRVGDEVATRQGNVVIALADGSTIRLEQESSLVFNRLSHFGKTGMVDTQLRLNKGSLTTNVPPLVKGSRYEIKTPSAVAAVRGTEFRLHSDNSATRIEVLEGVVEFSGDHGSLNVQTGQGASIKQNNPRIELIQLPPPPKTRLASENINELPARIDWESDAQAQAYHVRLTANDKNGKLVNETRQQANSVELNQLNNGQYELAVSSINNQGFQGSDARNKININIKGLQAVLQKPFADDTLDIMQPDFSWRYSSEDASPQQRKNIMSKLEVALDEGFAAVITDHDFIKEQQFNLQEPLIPGRYYWRVASLINNTEISYSETRAFNIRGQIAPISISSVNYLDKQVGLFWSPVPNSDGYVLQVSDQSNFSEILKEEKLSKPRAHLLLNAGKLYFARVKAITSELYVSEYGPIQEIFIQPN